jgi:5'-nucleotidase
MNVGGVREDLPMEPKYTEQSGQITFAEAFDIAPFGNLLVTVDLTGDQLRQVLEEQYQPIPARGSRPMLALGVSSGFTYEWDATQPQGSRVVPGSMELNGTAISPTATYRVGTLNFLADGGDSFNAFKASTNRLGGAEDLANLVAYFESHPALAAPADRIGGL